MPFVGTEEERLVLYDRAAEGCAKLVVLESRFSWFSVEIVARVELLIPQKIKQRPVKLVGAGTRNNVYNRPAIPSVFRAKVRLQIKFCDRVDGKKGRWRSGDTDLI